jgi:hypothetical protein
LLYLAAAAKERDPAGHADELVGSGKKMSALHKNLQPAKAILVAERPSKE